MENESRLTIPASSRSEIFATFLEDLRENAGFYFSMLISLKLIDNSFYGGAMYMAGRLLGWTWTALRPSSAVVLPPRERRKYALAAPLAALAAAALVFGFPLFAGWTGIGQLLLFVGILCVDSAAREHTDLAPPKRASRTKRTLVRLALMSVTGLVLFLTLDPSFSLVMLSYYAIYFLVALLIDRLRRNLTVPAIVLEDAESSLEDDMLRVTTYRFYWTMNANLNTALRISVLLLVSFLPRVTGGDFWGYLLKASILLGLYLVAASLSKLVLQRGRIREMGKTSIYILFSCLWIFTNVHLYRNAATLDALDLYLAFALMCLCITSLTIVLIAMDSDMQIIGELGLERFSLSRYRALKWLMHRWSLYISHLVLLFLIGAMAFFLVHRPGKIAEPERLGQFGLTLLPALFLLAGVVAAIRQPLTKYYEHKLRRYILPKRRGMVNKSLEERLRFVLASKYRKRIGIRVLYVLLKPFFKLKVIGRHQVDPGKFPVVFACNHSEIYGPIASVLNLGFFVRPWINHEMVDEAEIADHIASTFERQSWLPQFIRSKIAGSIGPIVAWAMRSMEPIPVFKTDIRKMLASISQSVDALEAEDNVLIFPEDPFKTDGYLREGVGEFYTGFVNIARSYYQRTGKALTFHSVFVDKRRRRLSFSAPVTFNPAALFHDEKRRVSDELYHYMLELAGEGTGA